MQRKSKAYPVKRLRRHLVLYLCAFAFSALVLVFSPVIAKNDLVCDEYIHFTHALSLLERGHFADASLDTCFLKGLPRGFLFTSLVSGSMKLFGPSEFAARLPAALIGLMCLFALYLLVYRYSGQRTPAIAAILLLATNPQFLQYSQCCRMYTCIVLLQLACIHFFYAGLEHTPIRSGAADYLNKRFLFRRLKIPNALRVCSLYFFRERVNPLSLLLFAVFLILNLNNHQVAGLLPVAFGLYGVVFCTLNCFFTALRRRGKLPAHPFFSFPNFHLSERLFHKYIVLSVFFACAVGLVWMASRGIVLSGAFIPNSVRHLDKIIGRFFDATFSQANAHYILMLFGKPFHCISACLVLLGAFAFVRFNPKEWKFGFFLFIVFSFLLATAVFAWKRTAERYGLFLVPLQIPLLAMGIFMAAHYSAGVLGRILFFRGKEKTLALVISATCALVLSVAPSGSLKEWCRAGAANPFGYVEYREGYDYLFSHIRRGDAAGFSYARGYYLHMAMEANGVTEDDYVTFSLLRQRGFRISRLLPILRKYPRGWLVWARQKEYHIHPELSRLCARMMKDHDATSDDTMLIYSWDEKQASDILEKYEKNR